ISYRFRMRIRGHDGGGEIVARPWFFEGSLDSSPNLVYRQRTADDTGRSHQYFFLAGSEQSGAVICHRLGMTPAFVAGHAVGVAAIDHNGADLTACNIPAAQHDRCSHNAVLRENSRGCGRCLAPYQPYIESVITFYAGCGRSGFEALGCQDAVVSLLHATSPSVSSNPYIRLKFCTPCPEAPFIRLSSTAVTTTKHCAGSTATCSIRSFVATALLISISSSAEAIFTKGLPA